MGKNLYEKPRDRHKWKQDVGGPKEMPLHSDSKKDRMTELKARLKKKKSK